MGNQKSFFDGRNYNGENKEHWQRANTVVYNMLHRTLIIEHHELHKITEVSSRALEG